MFASTFWNIIEGAAIVAVILSSIIGAIWWKKRQEPDRLSTDGVDTDVADIPATHEFAEGTAESLASVEDVDPSENVESAAAYVAANVEDSTDGSLISDAMKDVEDKSESITDAIDDTADTISQTTETTQDTVEDSANRIAEEAADKVEETVELGPSASNETVSELADTGLADSDQASTFVDTAESATDETLEVVHSMEDTVASDTADDVVSDVASEAGDLTENLADQDLSGAAADSVEEANKPLEFDMPSLSDNVATASLGASTLPPRRSQQKTEPTNSHSSSDSATRTNAFNQSSNSGSGSRSKDELLSRPIPPRRSKSSSVTPPPAAPATPVNQASTDQTSSKQASRSAKTESDFAVNSFASSAPPSLDDSGEIEVLSTHEYESQLAINAAKEELSEMRLALEASHHELSALTESREQALAIVSKHEREIALLKQQINAGPSDNAVEAVKAQHQSTVDELRSILGQREAAEASLARERDALTEQNAELQRKLDGLPDEAPTEPTGPDAESLARIQQLEQAHQQSASELSLANETVRQLNQNLQQRDAQLMGLRREHEGVSKELAALADAPQQPNDGDVPKETHEEALKAREEAVAELEKSQQETIGLKEEYSLLKQRLSGADEKFAAKNAELESAVTRIQELEKSQNELANIKQEFSARMEAKQAELVDAKQKWQESKKEIASAAAQPAPESLARIQELESQQQQVASELSLANETVRQLNQNLSQRDAQLMGLRRERDSVSSELAALSAASAAAATELADADDAISQEAYDAVVAAREAAANEAVAAKEELESAREELARLNAEASELREQLSKKSDDTASAVNDAKAIAVLMSERDETQEQIGVANRQLTETRRQLETVEAKLNAELQLEREKAADLQATIEELRSGEPQPPAQPADNSELIAAQVLIARLQDEKNSLQSKIEDTNVKLATAQAAISTSTPEASSSSDDTVTASDNAASNNAGRLAELESQLEQHEQYVAGLQAEKQDLLDRLGAYQEEIDMKSAEMRRMKDRLTAAESQSAVANEQQSAFQQSQETTESLTNALQSKSTELRRIQDEQIELKQGLAAFMEASEKWDAERLTLYGRLGLDEHGEPLDGDESDKADSKDSVVAVPETRIVQVPSEETLAEITRLKSALHDRDSAFNELQTRFEELQKMYEEADNANVLDGDVSDELDTLRADRDQAAAAAAASSATIAKLMTDISRLSSDSERKPAPKAQPRPEPKPNLEAEKRIADAEKQLVDTKKRMADAEIRIADAEKRTAESGKQSAELAAEIEKLTEENREYRRSVAELHAVANELEEARLERSREQVTARQRLQEATTANSELNATIASLSKQLEGTTEISDTVEQQIEAAEEAKRQAEQQLNAERRAKTQAEHALKSLAEQKAKVDAELKEIEEDSSGDAGSKKNLRKTATELKRLSKALATSEKKRDANDERLQELASELSKARVESKTLENQLTEQRAIVRALNDGQEISSSNGRSKPTKKTVTKKTATKKTAKKKTTTKNGTSKRKTAKTATTRAKSATPTKRDSNLGRIFTKRPAEVDDLKKILGVGPVLEKRLNSAGIYQFEQVRDWSSKTIEYLDESLSLAGRIERDGWLKQASDLAKKK